MRSILIVGGTKGIGKAIVEELIDNNKVICMSRNITDFTHDNYTHFQIDSAMLQL